MSRPARGAWVEMSERAQIVLDQLSSRPARGAWVEILRHAVAEGTGRVAPRKGRVG